MKTIQINRCTQEELEWLPGVGPKTAEKIVKARPIGAKTDLEQLVPPGAWLKIQETEVEFAFGMDGEESKQVIEVPEGESLMLDQGTTLTDVIVKGVPAEPIITLEEPEMTLRRVLPGQELKVGAEYLCIWNMQWGPDGQAVMPTDAPTQLEIEGWFDDHDMSVAFAHYGASIRLYTRNRGLVPLVLFEIIKETENAEAGTKENHQGNGQRD